MKAFRFSLEPVLELRRQAGERAALDLAVVCRKRIDLERERDLADARMEELRADVRERRAAGAAAWEEWGFRGAILRQEEAITECDKNLDRLREEERTAREALSKARVAWKALERLKARRKDRFMQEWERGEEREIQEIAGRAAARRTSPAFEEDLEPLMQKS